MPKKRSAGIWSATQRQPFNWHLLCNAAIEELRNIQRSSPLCLYGTRRCVLHDFPYSIIFYEFPDAIQIIAVAHAKRGPGYWSSRLKGH